MPICLTGMHRSHTSMLARILMDCGVYLGPKEAFSESNEDNQEGYWEDLRFQSIDERLLEAFGLDWDRVELPKDWLKDGRLVNLRAEARSLIDSNQAHEPWAWKDPRSCLTLGFWKELIDGLNTVVLVRSPVEVARSLMYRRYEIVPYDRGVELWFAYYNALERVLGDTPCLIVHSDSLLARPRDELGRVCEFLGLSVSSELLAHAVGSIRPNLTAGRFPDTARKEEQLPDDVKSLYARLRDQAGSFYQELERPEASLTPSDLYGTLDRLDRVLSEKTDELLDLRARLADCRADRDDLRAEIARIVATRWHRLGASLRGILRK